MRTIIFTILISLFTAPSFAQEKTDDAKKKFEETSFEVNGVCKMCKTRIEEAALVKGVKRAEWNMGKHILTVIYNPEHISPDQIRRKVADAGHDTDTIKASDEAYARLHHCCKYRTDKDH